MYILILEHTSALLNMNGGVVDGKKVDNTRPTNISLYVHCWNSTGTFIITAAAVVVLCWSKSIWWKCVGVSPAYTTTYCTGTIAKRMHSRIHLKSSPAIVKLLEEEKGRIRTILDDNTGRRAVLLSEFTLKLYDFSLALASHSFVDVSQVRENSRT